MTRNQTSNARCHDQSLECNGASFGSKSLVEKCQYRHPCTSANQPVNIPHTEEEGNGVGPGCDEADDDGAHDGDRDHLFGAVNLLGQMSCTVQAGESIIGIDQPDNESLEL